MSSVIRVLADRSRDAVGGEQFANLLPYSQFQSTDNRRPLTRSLLERYDVLAICGQSVKRYTRAELTAIREFVAEGGGLLLAASAPVFELETNLPVAKMAQNDVAGLFGAAFQSGDCAGARAQGELTVGIPHQAVGIRRHAALGGAGAGLIIGCCAPISHPEGAEIVASHQPTRQPIAAAFPFGEGRVAVVGESCFASERGYTCRAVARWLAAGGKAAADKDAQVAEYIGRRGGINRGDYFHVTYDRSCANRVEETLGLVDMVNAACKARFATAWKPPTHVALADAVACRRWGGYGQLGAQAPPASRVRQLLAMLVTRGVRQFDFAESLDAVFSHAAWRIHFVLGLLDELGFGDEAARCRERAERWIAEMDDRAKVFDLARNYKETREDCPRGLVVIREFAAEHGDEVLAKLAATIPEKDPWKHLPPNYAWPSDRCIYYLGLAAGKDLFPWFAERGVTVHPLPVVKPDAKDIEARMAARLNQALRDESESLSSRMDAALDLAAMKATNGLPADDWGALCAALKLSKQAERKAARKLRKLWAARKPAGIRAVAGLALADLGDASVADDLIPLARRFEPRFQLAAWYALTKAGSERADELSLENVTDADGNPAGELEVEFDGYIAMHCKVEGYKVNNIFSLPELRPFTADAAASLHSVHWVHTSPFWRRRGLSRYTMERTMNYPAAMKCSCSGLGTGTRNVAHRLYRDFGFVDMFEAHEVWTCALPGNAPLRLPTGVTFREYEDGDAPRALGFWREERRTTVYEEPEGLPHGELDPAEFGYFALRKRDIVGFASAAYSGGEEAHIARLAVKAKDEQRDAVADALLALIHRAVHRPGAKRIQWYEVSEDDCIRAALHRAGYEVKPTGGQWMVQVRHLVQFLQEIAPAIERRLAESQDFKSWEGVIDILAERHQARVAVSKAVVTASAPTARPADIVLRCDDYTATRIAFGRETPFQAYLQARMVIEPRVGEQLTKLLETVFPKVPL
ncbi:MAG: GNAT family N-acetyltransferase [Armatimonadota bacterium]|nr:MAG: GNAT family N-acetyltransferase [Armatimonadota bacterium]